MLRAVVPSVLALLAGCERQVEKPAPPPPKVEVVQPLPREVTEWDDYTARLEATETVEVRPQVSGYLESIHFKDGAIVAKGDLLFRIDPRPYAAALRLAEANLAQAQSRLELAEKNLARGAELIRSDAISREEADIRASNVQQAQAAVKQAQAAVDAARLDVEFTEISAPIAGRIGRRLVTEGNLISGGIGTQGTLLTTIVSLDPIYAYFEADERSYLKYANLARSGLRPSSREYRHPVWIGLAGEEGFPRSGNMDFVDNQLDRGTGTIIGRAVIPNSDLLLTPGLFARLRLPGSGTYSAMLIPDEAIANDQAKKFVFVVDADNVVQYRGVETGPLVDGLRAVLSGLSADDWVIYAGTQRARPGLRVEPQQHGRVEPRASPTAAAARPMVTAAPPSTATP